MKNVCRNNHKLCEFAQTNGCCVLTACKKGGAENEIQKEAYCD